MKTKKENNITTLDEIFDKKYGKRGAKKREQWEQEFDPSKIHSDNFQKQHFIGR
ncbi:MAG: hypothetical protein J0H29_21740 [Sphingobacteriales bacterium]|nr:hypothetical protein [Sphingobacteriales bacterium]